MYVQFGVQPAVFVQGGGHGKDGAVGLGGPGVYGTAPPENGLPCLPDASGHDPVLLLAEFREVVGAPAHLMVNGLAPVEQLISEGRQLPFRGRSGHQFVHLVVERLLAVEASSVARVCAYVEGLEAGRGFRGCGGGVVAVSGEPVCGAAHVCLHIFGTQSLSCGGQA